MKGKLVLKNKIDLIAAFIQFEGNCRFTSITNNHDNDGGVMFSGYLISSHKRLKFTIDKYMIESLEEAKTIEQVISVYKEIGFFKDVH